VWARVGRITIKDDSLPNTVLFTVEAEDHTLANLLRWCAPLPPRTCAQRPVTLVY